MKLLLLLCLLPLALAVPDWMRGPDGPRVVTPLGGIRGFWKHSFNGRKFMAFEGIPYAQPPVGDLRFRVSTNLNKKIHNLNHQRKKKNIVKYQRVIDDEKFVF